MSVRARFVRNVLEEEGRAMIRKQSAALSSQLESRSGHLISSRRVDISGGADMDGMMSFSHPDYERYLDIARPAKRKRRRRIHNRYTFGAYQRIAERLMFEFTDDVAAAIREQMARDGAV